VDGLNVSEAYMVLVASVKTFLPTLFFQWVKAGILSFISVW